MSKNSFGDNVTQVVGSIVSGLASTAINPWLIQHGIQLPTDVGIDTFIGLSGGAAAREAIAQINHVRDRLLVKSARNEQQRLVDALYGELVLLADILPIQAAALTEKMQQAERMWSTSPPLLPMDDFKTICSDITAEILRLRGLVRLLPPPRVRKRRKKPDNAKSEPEQDV